MNLHAFVNEQQLKQRLKLYRDGLNDCSKTPELSVFDIELVEHRNGHSFYRITMESGDKLDLERVSRFSRRWNKSEFAGQQKASAIGTEVHQAIELVLTGKSDQAIDHLSTDEARHCFNLFLDWRESNFSLTPLACECKVFSLSANLAGTVDCLLQDEQGRIVLVDFKTSADLDPSYRLQQWLYALCLSALGVYVSRAILVCLPKPHQGTAYREDFVWDDEHSEVLNDEQSAAVKAALEMLRTISSQKSGFTGLRLVMQIIFVCMKVVQLLWPLMKSKKNS